MGEAPSYRGGALLEGGAGADPEHFLHPLTGSLHVPPEAVRLRALPVANLVHCRGGQGGRVPQLQGARGGLDERC
eukprot:9479479-Pyramimonas_sp.AAC.2